MGDRFFVYIERLEVMVFFVAYPLLYLIIQTFAGHSKKEVFKQLPALLPYAYAIVGLLYLGLQLRNLYPDFSIANIVMSTQNPFLKIWGLLSLLFFLPIFSKKPIFSLLHSLVFLIFLLKDLLFYSLGLADKTVVQNDMGIYTNSLLINLFAFIVLFIFNKLIRLIKK